MAFREVEKLLIADGWFLVRICGSHYQYKKIGISYTATVPNHAGRDISINVLKDLEKKTGLSLRR